jgi:hypothetical protein
MPFPREIADEALVRCARRCCICRKFCGTRMQTHHIVQEADGGDNTINNCIPLCLDCHGEVVSYNPRHPIGRKFSPEELRQHRDVWFDFVQRHPERLNNSAETFFISSHIIESPAPLSDAARKLLVEASGSVDGFVSKQQSSMYGEIVNIHAKNQDFLGKIEDNRTRALWVHAFNELVQAGCFEPTGHAGIYSVTHVGFQLADFFKRQSS